MPKFSCEECARNHCHQMVRIDNEDVRIQLWDTAGQVTLMALDAKLKILILFSGENLGVLFELCTRLTGIVD